jgi:hypothetical protein
VSSIELSGWDGAYDLGYLLRKLPMWNGTTRLTLQPVVGSINDRWDASYDYQDGSSEHDNFADTPEDAVCKLCIELFKQGILQKEHQ